jgi:hypothetical protein
LVTWTIKIRIIETKMHPMRQPLSTLGVGEYGP